jgi:FkbM family methyltransferase
LSLNKILSSYKNKFNNKNHFFNLIKDHDFIICGHGEAYYAFERSVMNVLRVSPKFIVDSAISKKKNNKLNFDHLQKWDTEKINQYIYVICVGKKEAFNEIRKKLIKFKVKKNKIIWVLNIYEFNIHHWDNRYTLNNRNILKNKRKIIKAYNLLKDQKSKSIFLNLLSIYITHKPSRIKFENPDDQYFPNKIFRKKDYEYFINCGAFIGDTFNKYFLKYSKIMKKCILIEPDPKNFSFLKKNINKNFNSKSTKKVKLLNVACSNKESKLNFITNKGLSSRIIKNANFHRNSKNLIQVQSAKIENISLGTHNKIWYLSIDSEGYEKEILLGSKKLIKNEKLNMAISVYHKITDIWEIPLLINKFSKNYKLYLRNYSGFVYETILYAKK